MRELNVLRMVLVVLIAIVAHSAPAPSNGQQHVTFSEQSPHSPIDEMAKRAPFHGFKRHEDHPLYDIKSESFELFVPPTYKSAIPHGLLVFIAAGEGEVPREWMDSLSRHKLLFICPNNAGNGRDSRVRMALALDAAHKVCKQYNVDPSRVFLSGFSGGAAAASSLITAFPDVFRGGIFIGHGTFYELYAQPDGRIVPTVYGAKWDGSIEDHKKHLSLVLVAGQDDREAKPLAKACYEGFILDGFERTSYIEIPHTGHAYPNAIWFERAVSALEAPSRPAPTTSPSDEKKLTPGQSAQAARILSTAQYHFHHKMYPDARHFAQMIVDDYPFAPAAASAKDLLRQSEDK